MPHVPHEVVTEILLRLPVSSLLRFSCVCKTWRATISDDPTFRRDLRLRRHRHPSLLILPRIKYPKHDGETNDAGLITTAGLYRWEEARGAAIFTHPIDSPPSRELHRLAHCDGLVMVVTESMVRVLNPATRRVLTLPWAAPGLGLFSYPAFGLGHDPRTDAYKIVRLFQQSEYEAGHIIRTSCVEVFTIGAADQQWRQIAVQQPHLVMTWQTATFFKGSLLWNISRHDQDSRANGFLRLRLDNETFGVIPPPPTISWFANDDVPALSELRGELCAACPRKGAVRTLDLWMCADMDSNGANLPQWEKRYTIHWDWRRTSPRPVAVLDDAVLVCQASGNRLLRCMLQTQKQIKVKDKFHMKSLEYYNLEEDTLLEFPHDSASYFDVIPYVPSSVPI